MILAPAGIAWFARHETGLAWRDFVSLMSGGRSRRGVAIIATLLVAAVLLHLLAFGLVTPWIAGGIVADKPTLVLLTGFGLLFFSVMLSQALESVTRAYYARSDLDLILSSPASARALFAVRTAGVAGSTMLLACLLASPLVNALALLDDARWLAAYPVLGALGAFAAGLAILVTISLFRLVGPRRTRLVAQIIAAIVGAAFIIGIQAAAILYYGTFSRFSLFQSAGVIAAAPAIDSLAWLPARAAMGEAMPVAATLVLGFGSLLAIIALSASSYGHHALSAASVGVARQKSRTRSSVFRTTTPRAALRIKEWRLLARDPWLVSQTLMQILYLLPPALMLWINYGQSAGAYVVVVPVLVMAAGQLAGGLAWLAISGEDAHDFVGTAPLAPGLVLRAKVEAVLSLIGFILAPLLLLMAFGSWPMALVTAACAALASASATAIQLRFRTQSRRALFRRRQVASRASTLCEAFASVMWAATGALWAAGSLVAIAPALVAGLILLAARAIAPRG